MKSEPFSITLSKKKKQSAFYNASSALSKLLFCSNRPSQDISFDV